MHQDQRKRRAILRPGLHARHTVGALMVFGRMDRLTLAPDPATARELLLRDWAATSVKEPLRSVIFTATTGECAQMNALAQRAREAEGLLGVESVLNRRNSLRVSDVLTCGRDSPTVGIVAGDRGVVTSLCPVERGVTLLLATGKEVKIPLSQYPYVKLGYALPADRVPARLPGQAFVLIGSDSRHQAEVLCELQRQNTDTRLYFDAVSLDLDLQYIPVRQRSDGRERPARENDRTREHRPAQQNPNQEDLDQALEQEDELKRSH